MLDLAWTNPAIHDLRRIGRIPWKVSIEVKQLDPVTEFVEADRLDIELPGTGVCRPAVPGTESDVAFSDISLGVCPCACLRKYPFSGNVRPEDLVSVIVPDTGGSSGACIRKGEGRARNRRPYRCSILHSGKSARQRWGVDVIRDRRRFSLPADPAPSERNRE